MRLIKWLSKLFPFIKKEEIPEVVSSTDGLPEAVVWQTSLLTEDEVLVYVDSEGEEHYFTVKPLDTKKEYQVLILKHEDIT